MFNNWNGRWTLITGASAGIGKVFAEVLAAGKSNLVLTARRLDRLQTLADQLVNKHKIKVECVAADLADPAGPNQIFDFTQARNLPIDFLINNAGYGDYGEFAKLDRRRQIDMVQVNCSAVVSLTHLYLPGMIQRKRGDIIILASTASYQAVPYMSVYAATKAFDLFFAEGLAQEMSRFGIRVCGLCPGATESDFHDTAKLPSNVMGSNFESAEKVVGVGLRALLAGKHSVVSGVPNQVGANLNRLLPRRVVTHVAARLFRPK